MTDEEKEEDRRWGWAILIGIAALFLWGHENAQKDRQDAAQTAAQFGPEMQACLARISYANLPQESLVKMCKDEISGRLKEPDCHNDWDARANPNVCD
jgi:hypothetical protein